MSTWWQDKSGVGLCTANVHNCSIAYLLFLAEDAEYTPVSIALFCLHVLHHRLWSVA